MPPSKGLTQPLVNAKKTKDIFERKEDRGRKELVMNFDVFRVKKSALGFRKPNLRFLMVPKKFLMKCTKFEINFLLI